VALAEARAYAKAELDRLPRALLALDPADPPYRVEVSAGLEKERSRVQARLEASRGRP